MTQFELDEATIQKLNTDIKNTYPHHEKISINACVSSEVAMREFVMERPMEIIPNGDDKLSFKPNNPSAEAFVTSLSTGLARRQDQLKIDALNEAYQHTIATSVGGANTNLNNEKVWEAKAYMDRQGVPEMDRYFLCHVSQAYSLLGQEEVEDAHDYNINTHLGFTFITIGSFEIDDIPDIRGLPKTGNVRSCFAWHKDSLGFRQNFMGMTAHPVPEWHNDFLFRKEFDAGAQIIEPKGVVKIECTEEDD